MVSKKPSSSSSRAAAPTASSTVAPSQLGLTNGEEIATFQRHQQVALSRANNSNARTAAANGRVLVDANSLMLLANYFDHVMAVIQQRADLVSTRRVSSSSLVYIFWSRVFSLDVCWVVCVFHPVCCCSVLGRCD